MKKVFVSLCMASCCGMGLSSCASTKNAATLSSLSGEWNIIEINGTAVVPAPGQEFPYIGFDTKTGQVYGNSGCNRLMGSFDVNAKPGTDRPWRIGKYPYDVSGYDSGEKRAGCFRTGKEV